MEKKKLFTYVAAGCLLLGLIMSFTGVLSVSYGGFGITASLGTAQATWAMILIILIDLVGIAALVLPMFGILTDKADLLWKVALCCACLALVLFIIAFFVIKGKAGEGSSLIHLAFTGWLFMIFQIGAAVCTFLASKEE